MDHASAIPTKGKACWSQIGTWGQRDCPELSRHIHCRNCPTYAEAAAFMLDGPLPEGYVEAWTEHFARAKAELPRDTSSMVVFRIHHEWFGLPVGVLTEVVDRRPVHSLPHTRSSALLGLVNIRGQLRVCVSLAKLLRAAEEPPTAAPSAGSGQAADQINPERLLVVRTEGGPIVFPVQEVFGLWHYRAVDLLAVPATVARGGGRFTQALLAWTPRAHASAGSNQTARAEMVGLLNDQLLFRAINRALT
jgi:chemotaxis-related protein WspD